MSKIILFRGKYLTFYNYKEPLKEIPKGKGFGYYGTVLVSVDGKSIQCHICGGLYRSLTMHLRHQHHTTPTKYKEQFDLARRTALISEEIRLDLKEKTIKWFASLTAKEKKELKEKAKVRYKKWAKKTNYKGNFAKHRLETKNKRGTCPDQLLAKIQEVSKKLGHTPSKKEFIDETGSQRFVHLIYKTFGSWTKAVKKAGLQLKQQENNGGRRGYSDEELLEYLQIFYKEEGKIPTHTDCRRGLIPSAEIYKIRFGSLPKARELAGITEKPSRWGILTS